MSSKLITVFGATGFQGGSVVNSLLENKSGEFRLRAITRNPESESAKALASRGIEVVKADGLKKEQLVAAFRDSWGVFVNTNSDDPAVNSIDGPNESDLGRVIVDAAVEAGVLHFVYSGFEGAHKITNGAISNKAFDEKYLISEYAKSNPFISVVIVSPGWYLENHLSPELAPAIGGFPFEKDDEGYLSLRLPLWGGKNEVPFIGISDDFGDIVHGVFLGPEKYNGQLLQAASFCATLDDMVAEFETVTEQKARFVVMDNWRDMETYGMTELETVKYMFGCCQHSGGLYYGRENDTSTAQDLKSAASKAKGTSDEMASFTEFFKKHFC